MKTFILGTLSLPFEAHLELSQDYEEERSERLTAHADGSARKIVNWSGKTKTRLSGSGWIPTGFDALDYETSMEMSCIGARCVTRADRVITIPSARRADAGFEPYAAVTINGGRQDATIASTVGDIVTVAAVPEAQFYHVYYYPKLTVFASLPTQRHDVINDRYSWELEAREV